MRFANSWDIAEYRSRFAGDPILEPAAETLHNLARWADQNSDGWAYWPKPARAAARLIEFLEHYAGGYGNRFTGAASRETIASEYRAALRPIKAFRTRAMSGAFGAPLSSFDILEGGE